MNRCATTRLSSADDNMELNMSLPSLKALVRFMSFDKDNDLVLFRRFKKLSLYLLLDQQDCLREIDDRLRKWEDRKPDENGIRDLSVPDSLADDLKEARGLLKDYHEALLRQKQIMSLPAPSKRLTEYLIYEAARRTNEWLPIIKEERIDDMVSLADSEKAFIHKYIRKTPWLEKLFYKEQPHDPDRPPDMNLYSERHVRQVETFLITVAFGLLVLGPVTGLSYLHKTWLKLVIITVAMICSSILASALSDNTHRGSLAVIAAYTAILAVFLGNSIQ